MQSDDLFKPREQTVQRVAVAAHIDVPVRCMKEPKSCVGCMVKPLTGSFWKHVGNEPVFQIHREGAENVACLRNATRCEGQSFQADHRVSSPIGEPVVARNDCALFIADSVGPSRVFGSTGRMDHELIRSKYKLGANARLECRVREFDQSFSTHAFCLKGLLW